MEQTKERDQQLKNFLMQLRIGKTLDFVMVAKRAGCHWKVIKNALRTEQDFRDDVQEFLDDIKYQLLGKFADGVIGGKRSTDRDYSVAEIERLVKVIDSGCLLGPLEGTGKPAESGAEALRKLGIME